MNYRLSYHNEPFFIPITVETRFESHLKHLYFKILMELLNKTKRERKVNKGSYYKIKTDFGFSQEKFLYFINTYSYVVQYQINRHKKEEQKERTTMNLL